MTLNTRATAEGLHAAADLQHRLAPPLGHALEALEEDPGRLPPGVGAARVDEPDAIEIDAVDEEDGEDDVPVVRARRSRPAPARHRVARRDERAAKAAEAGQLDRLRARQTEQDKALVARVLEFMRDRVDGVVVGEISRALGANVYMVAKACGALVLTRQLIRRETTDNRTRYCWPKPGDLAPAPAVKTIAIPAFDRQSYGESVAAIFDSGASYDINELVRLTHQQWPQSDAELMRAALNVLLEAQRIERLQLGTLTRYRKCPPPAKERLA